MWKVIENNFLVNLKEAVKGMRMGQDNKVSYMCSARLHVVMVSTQLHVHVEGVFKKICFYLTSLMLSCDEQ